MTGIAWLYAISSVFMILAGGAYLWAAILNVRAVRNFRRLEHQIWRNEIDRAQSGDTYNQAIIDSIHERRRRDH